MDEIKFSVADPRGITVTCSESQWTRHIISRHPDYEHHIDNVLETIRDPNHIYSSGNEFRPDREVYHGPNLNGAKGYTRIVTSPINKFKSEVVTVIPVEGVGESVNPDELKYIRSRLR